MSGDLLPVGVPVFVRLVLGNAVEPIYLKLYLRSGVGVKTTCVTIVRRISSFYDFNGHVKS